jgi:hypothetical protein
MAVDAQFHWRCRGSAEVGVADLGHVCLTANYFKLAYASHDPSRAELRSHGPGLRLVRHFEAPIKALPVKQSGAVSP